MRRHLLALGVLLLAGFVRAGQEAVVSFTSADGRFAFTVDCTEAPDLAPWAETKLKPVVAEWYGRLADEFACPGYAPRKTLTYRLRKAMKNPGMAHGGTIDLHVSWIRKNLDNRKLGMVIHETWHTLQRYKAKAPSWLKEGVADWVRYCHYEKRPPKVNLKKARADAGYGTTAAFLDWCERGTPGFVRSLIADLRQGRFDEGWWQRKTRRTLAELEADWKSGAPPPSRRSATAVPPLRGLVLWPDEAADHKELEEAIALEFSYLRPCDIVSAVDAEGVPTCDWSSVDRLLADMASRGHQAILRFRYEYPGEKLNGVKGATAVPACIKAQPGYKETFAKNPNGDGPTWYADWSNELLKRFTLRFLGLFAARYDDDPRLAFLEVGFGHWAEYHICGTPVKLGENFPDFAYQMRFLTEMDRLFKETPWMISIDAAEREHAPIAGNGTLAKLGFGLFDDSFMCAQHEIGSGDGTNERRWRALGQTRWRRAPCGGEISYYDDGDQREFLGPKGIHVVTWEKAAAKYHLTFMIANDSLGGPHATADRFRTAAEACGWAFRLTRRETRNGRTRLGVVNCGVAPAYHDVRVALGDRTSEVSLRGLLPGETRTVEFPFESATDEAMLVSRKFLPGVTVPLKLR